MLAMRELTDEFKISARSIGEVTEIVAVLTTRAAMDPTIRFGGKKPTRASVVNALLLWLDDQPGPEQKRIVREGMALLNRILGDEPAALTGPDSDSKVSYAVDRVDADDGARARRRRKA